MGPARVGASSPRRLVRVRGRATFPGVTAGSFGVVDLIPKPGQILSAAGNVAHGVLNGGLADLRSMPRTLVGEGALRQLYHYRPSRQGRDQADPVLLVTPLAAPALCYDLRRGCSLVEHLVDAGRPTYLVEYGEVPFSDRSLSMEPWVDDVVPTAIREASAHAGGRPVHVIGWSLGGTFGLLAAAGDRSLPIASLAVLGSPFDVRQVPLVAPMRPLLDLTDGHGALSRIYEAAGGATQPLLRWAVELPSFQKLVTKPLAMARGLDDADYLAQLQAVDRFAAEMAAYPGRTFGQLYHRLLTANSLARGRFDVGERSLDVADVSAPVLVVGGAHDTIAPTGSVKAGVPLLTGSREVRFEIVPGGHLGMLTGRQARTGTWPLLDAWVDEWSATGQTAPVPARRTSTKPAAAKATTRKAAARKGTVGKPVATKAVTKKAPAKKAPAKKASATRTATTKTATTKKAPVKKASATSKATTKKATTKKASARKTAATRATQGQPSIGVNPERRYGSSGSRALGR
jgi:polyhydroxyalkanoate synthase subunit PhaC